MAAPGDAGWMGVIYVAGRGREEERGLRGAPPVTA